MFARLTDTDEKNRKLKRKELKVLFVSKHDSCRGPMAESIFQSIAERHAMKPYSRFLWRSASAGLSRYLPGNLPEQLALRVLAENGLDTVHGCRQVSQMALKLSFPFDRTVQFIYDS
jgi:protein-tyrosine-phosphatase